MSKESRKKANTVPNNSNRSQDIGIDPQENPGEGYSGPSSPGTWVEPKEGSAQPIPHRVECPAYYKQGQKCICALLDKMDESERTGKTSWGPDAYHHIYDEDPREGAVPEDEKIEICPKCYGDNFGIYKSKGPGTHTRCNDCGWPDKQTMKAILKQNLGSLRKGELVIITGTKEDKAFFYVAKNSSLVGVASRKYFESEASFKGRKVAASDFLACHGSISKSASFVQKIALDFDGLVDSSILDQLQSIKDTVSESKDRVMNQLAVSPQINANIRLADAATYFAIQGKIPTELDTVRYIKASMAAHTGLSEETWSDEAVKTAILNRKAEGPLDWSDKMMLMQQWHLGGKVSQDIWQSLMQVLDSSDLNEVKVGVEKLFDKASEVLKGQPQKPEKTAEPIPPAPTTPPPSGKKYIWDATAIPGQYVLVDASLTELSELKKK